MYREKWIQDDFGIRSNEEITRANVKMERERDLQDNINKTFFLIHSGSIPTNAC